MKEKDLWDKDWCAVHLDKDQHGVDVYAVLTEDSELICTLPGQDETSQVLADLISLVPMFLDTMDPDRTFLRKVIQDARQERKKFN